MDMQDVDHLVAAVLRGDRGRVEELVADHPERGTARNMFGVAPLHAAHFTGRDDLVALLAPPPAGGDDLFLAAELGDVDAVDRLLGEGPGRVRDFDARGATALHGACYWGQVAAARRLLAAGADPTAATRDTFLRISPLGSAIAATPGVPQPSDDEDVVLALTRLLLEHGAEPNHARLDGMTPLHAAAWRGLDRVVQELLDAGADRAATATAGPHAGETPGDTALTQGHLVLASALDSGVADVASPYA
jgi:ankyrin